MGYATCENGYRVFDPISKKLVLSRDIAFNEEATWNWEENSDSLTSTTGSFTYGDTITERSDIMVLSPTSFALPPSRRVLSVEEFKVQSKTYVNKPNLSEMHTQGFDHTPLKWRKLDEVLAQCNMCIMDPEKYEDAKQDESWLKATKDELFMIEKNVTWKLVDRPTEQPVIGVKWVYKTKLNLDGSVLKNKARLKKYASSLLSKFGLNEVKFVTTPLVATEKLTKDDGNGSASEEMYNSIMGSLLYLTVTRPDIMYAASLLARFMHCSTNRHYGTANRVLRYIKGTLDYGLEYIKGTLDYGLEYVKGRRACLIGYCDSDWGGSLEGSKSTSGYAYSFGSGMFSWASVKQNYVALSTVEAEYISASSDNSSCMAEVCFEGFWRIAN
nr:uncharacterized protein LOC114821438 [Malus domestica]